MFEGNASTLSRVQYYCLILSGWDFQSPESLSAENLMHCISFQKKKKLISTFPQILLLSIMHYHSHRDAGQQDFFVELIVAVAEAAGIEVLSVLTWAPSEWCNTGIELRFGLKVDLMGSIMTHSHFHLDSILTWPRPQ